MKKARHEKILELIQTYQIETQEELAVLLGKEGYPVTQATISRDIRRLGLEKVSSGNGGQRYMASASGERSGIGDDELPAGLKFEVSASADRAPGQEKYIRVLREGFVSMDMAQNILVIKTVSGMAMAVAAALDALRFPEVVGSIAGDDTIMAAVRTVEDTNRLMEKIQGMIVGNKD